ncbi:MAG: hypothetical protein WD904_12040 [Dehalococcoidia bacterium]
MALFFLITHAQQRDHFGSGYFRQPVKLRHLALATHLGQEPLTILFPSNLATPVGV